MNGDNDVSVVVQEMNNFDFNFDEKYVVLESVLCGNNDILHVARAIFNNKDDAEFYVNHSSLNLVIEEAYSIEDVTKNVPIYFIDIRYGASSCESLVIDKKCTNNFDIKNKDELNSISIIGNVLHIQKEVDKNYDVTSSKDQIVKVCREIFGYLKDDELYNPYSHVVTKMTDDDIKKKYLDLIR